ncbi:hypothetical protein ACFWB0_05820 [Rhodococcus sp. NPDC060086]|uniref:hypothetical protein n=1 Tax=Rhodococcus sp. NPDC060086 TaxID=3347055 RepID=UPI0036464022
MYVDTALVREFASTMGATGVEAGEIRTDSGCSSVIEGLPGSSIATAVMVHALLAHTALQQVAYQLADARDRLIASAEAYDTTQDDTAAQLVSVDGSALW